MKDQRARELMTGRAGTLGPRLNALARDLAFDDGDGCAAWLRGEDSLAPVIADFDAAAVAATFDSILASA